MYRITCADASHAEAVVEIVQEAFLVDAYFKKPEFAVRGSMDEILEILSNPSAVILVITAEHSKIPVGCIHVYWDAGTKKCSFGMVSVRESQRGKGLGKKLVLAAESVARDKLGVPCVMSIGVIDSREDLIPFYEKLGYTNSDRREPFAEPHILREGFSVQLIIMEKILE
jgi:GNAT superfamily N-acetyltransferase